MLSDRLLNSERSRDAYRELSQRLHESFPIRISSNQYFRLTSRLQQTSSAISNKTEKKVKSKTPNVRASSNSKRLSTVLTTSAIRSSIDKPFASY